MTYNKEYVKQYNLVNKDRIAEYKRLYYIKNKERITKIKNIYKAKNNDKILDYIKKYNLEHRLERNAYVNKYFKDKYKTDPSFKLKKKFSSYLRHMLFNKNEHKNHMMEKYLKCSVSELKLHIQKQFKECMTWQNHGRYGWHIDHIIPLSKFDFTKEEDIYKCCHFTNLQPLWETENLTKRCKII